MPELPEVETVRRGLAPVLVGRRIRSLALNRADLRKPFPSGLAHAVEGRQVLALDRRAKYLLMRLEGGIVMLVHLGMTGRFFVPPPGHVRGRHDHMVLTLDDGSTIVFNDARRFGSVDLVGEDRLATLPALAGLGPEPLGDKFTGALLHARLAGRRTSFKAALMDQRTVAGLGNIYVCEALFRARIDPARLAATITLPEARRLAQAVRDVLEEAIASGGSTLRDFVDAKGAAGYFQHSFDVYDRQDQPCTADPAHRVARISQAGRSTFYCPRCQKPRRAR